MAAGQRGANTVRLEPADDGVVLYGDRHRVRRLRLGDDMEHLTQSVPPQKAFGMTLPRPPVRRTWLP
jgi:hypothetical protein